MIYYKKQEHGYWQEIQISEVEDSKLSFTYIIKPLSFQVPCGIPNAKYCWHAEGHPSLHQGTRMLLTFGQTWKHCTTNWDQVHSWSTGAYKHSGPQASGLRTQFSNHVWIESLAIRILHGIPQFVAWSQFNHEGSSRKQSLPLSPHYSHALLIAVHYCSCMSVIVEDVYAKDAIDTVPSLLEIR